MSIVLYWHPMSSATPIACALAELGGRGVEETDHMVTETLIRGMYEYWRQVMEADDPQPGDASAIAEASA